jgi:hypothetical protein
MPRVRSRIRKPRASVFLGGEYPVGAGHLQLRRFLPALQRKGLHPAEGRFDLFLFETDRQQLRHEFVLGQQVAFLHDILGDETDDGQNPFSEGIR